MDIFFDWLKWLTKFKWEEPEIEINSDGDINQLIKDQNQNIKSQNQVIKNNVMQIVIKLILLIFLVFSILGYIGYDYIEDIKEKYDTDIDNVKLQLDSNNSATSSTIKGLKSRITTNATNISTNKEELYFSNGLVRDTIDYTSKFIMRDFNSYRIAYRICEEVNNTTGMKENNMLVKRCNEFLTNAKPYVVKTNNEMNTLINKITENYGALKHYSATSKESITDKQVKITGGFSR